MARAGYTPYRILTAYYGSDLELVRNAPVGTVQNTAPTSPLRLGSANNDVRLLQIRLNRISNNYPNIPKIPYVNGIFADATENAVREFQKTFNLAQDGIVGSATWFAVERIYAAVKQLNSLESEGLTFNEVSNQFPGVLRRGDANTGVSLLQYYLDFLSVYYDGIPSIAVDGIFGEDTENAVYAAQSVFGLSVDGLVGEQTWETIVDAYLGIIETIPVRYTEGNTIPFQGTILREGDESEVVRVLQEYRTTSLPAFRRCRPPARPDTLDRGRGRLWKQSSVPTDCRLRAMSTPSPGGILPICTAICMSGTA